MKCVLTVAGEGEEEREMEWVDMEIRCRKFNVCKRKTQAEWSFVYLASRRAGWSMLSVLKIERIESQCHPA